MTKYGFCNTSERSAQPALRMAVTVACTRHLSLDGGPTSWITRSCTSRSRLTRKAEGLGAKILMPKRPVPEMGWFAQLTDPEGNIFAIWQTDPKAGLAGAVSEEAARA